MGAAGSAPSGPRLDSGGRSCPPFARLLLLPGRLWASGTASLFHRTGCPRRSRGGARPPLPGFAPSSEVPAAAAAAAPPTASQQPPPPPSPWTRRAAPIGEAFWGRGFPGTTPTRARAEAILSTRRTRGRWGLAVVARRSPLQLCGRCLGHQLGLVALPLSRRFTYVLSCPISNPGGESGIWPSLPSGQVPARLPSVF